MDDMGGMGGTGHACTMLAFSKLENDALPVCGMGCPTDLDRKNAFVPLLKFCSKILMII